MGLDLDFLGWEDGIGGGIGILGVIEVIGRDSGGSEGDVIFSGVWWEAALGRGKDWWEVGKREGSGG